jgi:hypothetical protein
MKHLKQGELVLCLVMLVLLGWWRFDGWERVWWSLGVLLSVGVLLLDQLLYAYWLRPHEQLSEYVRHLVRDGRYLDSVKVLWARRGEQERLITQSVLFLAAWPFLTLYVMTSTASGLVLGMLFGLGMVISLRMIRMRHDTVGFARTWLWQIKRDKSSKEVWVIFMGWLSVVLVLTSLWLLG